MDLETLIVAVFCLVDDFVRDLCRERRLRQRGPAPVLADSEVLTIEIVGEFLGLDTDRALYAHFRRYHAALFPRLTAVHPVRGTAPPSRARRPTSGRRGARSGGRSPRRSPATRRLGSSTACRCRSAASRGRS